MTPLLVTLAKATAVDGRVLSNQDLRDRQIIYAPNIGIYEFKELVCVDR